MVNEAGKKTTRKPRTKKESIEKWSKKDIYKPL
jgi:hypothetical protein